MPRSETRIAALLAAGLAVCSGCAGEPGYVKIATPGVAVQVRHGWGKTTKITQESGTVAFPAGTYGPEWIALVTELSEGDGSSRTPGGTWTLMCHSDFGRLGSIRVRKNETTVLKAGPPLVVRAHPQRRGDIVFIDLSITGQAGEVYSPVVYRNRSHRPPPTLKILDAAGKVLHTGTFRYG